MPPITLTRQQFLKQRPQGNYQVYRNYIARARASKPAAVGSGGYPMTIQSLIQNYGSYLPPSPAALQANAAKTIGDELTRQTSLLKGAYAEQKADLQNQADRAHGFAQALATATQPDANQIAGLYRGAADRLRGYGTGLTGDVAAAQQQTADQANQAIQTVLGSSAPASGGYSIDAIRNAAQMAGVTIPGTTLESRAADAAKQALYDRAAHAASVADVALPYEQKIRDLGGDLKSKISDILSQEPGLVSKQITDERTATRQDLATLISALGLQNTIAGTQAGITRGVAGPAGVVPGTAKPAVKNWRNPNAGGAVQPVPAHMHVEGKYPNNKLVWDQGYSAKNPTGSRPGGAKGTAPTHLQSKQIAGPDGKTRTFLFDPVTKKYYLSGDTVNPVDPNTYVPKPTAEGLQQARAKAQTMVSYALNNPKDGDPKASPASIYARMRAAGVERMVALWALRQEAQNHPDSDAWQRVTKAGWLAGTQGK